MVLFWLSLVVHVLCTPKNFLSIILVFFTDQKKKKNLFQDFFQFFPTKDDQIKSLTFFFFESVSPLIKKNFKYEDLGIKNTTNEILGFMKYYIQIVQCEQPSILKFLTSVTVP